MTIIVTEAGIQHLRDKLANQLEPYDISKSEVDTGIVEHLVKAIQAKSRWINIEEKEARKLFERFNKPFNKSMDYRTTLGKIRIQYIDGVFSREWCSSTVVLKGWHKEAIENIKAKQDILLTREISEIIFHAGQEVVRDTTGEYLQTTNPETVITGVAPTPITVPDNI